MEVDLAACLRRDPQAWEHFVREAAPVIVNAVVHTMKGTTDRDDPEVADRVQEVFVRLLQNDGRLLRTFDRKRASLPTWLSVVARSVTIDALRKRKSPSISIDAISDLAAGSLREKVPGPSIPVHILTERQQAVLHLLFDRGMSVDEAATVLGVDNQTIRSAKHKALQRLREHFGSESPE